MAATIVQQKKIAFGPIMGEFIYCTGVTDQDTVQTTIQNPICALASETNADANSTVQVAVSGKTLTIHNQTAGAAAGKVAILVFGF